MSKNVFGEDIIQEQAGMEKTPVSEALVDTIAVDVPPVEEAPVTDAVEDPTAKPEAVIEDIALTQEDSNEESNLSKAEVIANRNFSAMRESKRELEAQLAEQAKQLKAFDDAKKKQQEISGDDDLYLDEDEKKQKAYTQQQQNMQQMYAQTQAMQAEIRLKQKYQDFDDVVSADNVDVLKALYPKAAYEIINEQDIYAKAEKAYEAMKKYNIFTSDDSLSNNASAQKEKVAKNIAKPRPLSSAKAGSPALGAANAFADDSREEKRRVFAEMRRLARGE